MSSCEKKPVACSSQQPAACSSQAASPCSSQAASPCCGGAKSGDAAVPVSVAWFDQMIAHCLDYARAADAQGRPVVGIMCEFTPREVIMAAGAAPVCLCGGSAATIPAAEETLPVLLCPLIKSTYGYHIQKSNPFLEMAALIVAEDTCDGKKKMYELMAAERPMYVLELPKRQGDADAMAYWEAEIRRFIRALEQRFGVVITEARLRDAVALMNRERGLRRRIAALMKSERPPITGRQLLNLKSSISAIPEDLEQYEAVLQALEGQEGPAGRAHQVRVLMTGVPVVHGTERVVDIIEQSGGLVVCHETCTGVKPILEDIDVSAPDITAALAEKYFYLPCSVMTRNDARLDSLRQLAREYRAECVIDLVWQGCLTYDVEAALVKRLAEEELGLPYLRIQTEYSPSDSARIAVRVQALFETIRHYGAPATA